MAKRKRKSERIRLKEQCLKLAKQIAKARDGYTCQKCGRTRPYKIDGSHVVPVSLDGRLASDPINIKALCSRCHLHWWHVSPAEAGPWFIERFPARWEYLQAERLANQRLGTIHIDWFRWRKDQLEKQFRHGVK